MKTNYKKSDITISIEDFLASAKNVIKYESSGNRRYVVEKVEGDSLFVSRADSKNPIELAKIDLTALYKGYSELTNFKTENFRQYLPGKHSPSRGLLIHLGLIKEI